MAKLVIEKAIDEVIRDAYVKFHEQFGAAADKIVASPDLSTRFADQVNARLSADEQMDVETVNRRIINLRRLGQAKGGLPRLERNYSGRETQPQRAVKPR